MSIGTELRNPIELRLADKDKEPVTAWLEANSARNEFDSAVLDYPATKVLAATNGNGRVLAYMPLQGTAMLESIGANPEATPMEVAAGIVEMVKGAALMAHAAGYRELYFLATDDNTAEGSKRLGFEELPFRVFRKRLG